MSKQKELVVNRLTLHYFSTETNQWESHTEVDEDELFKNGGVYVQHNYSVEPHLTKDRAINLAKGLLKQKIVVMVDEDKLNSQIQKAKHEKDKKSNS